MSASLAMAVFFWRDRPRRSDTAQATLLISCAAHVQTCTKQLMQSRVYPRILARNPAATWTRTTNQQWNFSNANADSQCVPSNHIILLKLPQTLDNTPDPATLAVSFALPTFALWDVTDNRALKEGKLSCALEPPKSPNYQTAYQHLPRIFEQSIHTPWGNLLASFQKQTLLPDCQPQFGTYDPLTGHADIYRLQALSIRATTTI